MMPWPLQKPTKADSSLQMETKHTPTGEHNRRRLLENFYPTFKTLIKLVSKMRIGIVENLLAAMFNPKEPESKGSLASF